ncbi:MarR family transcriptional regulator [Micromonospora sp. NBC_00898]|uniref:MarR family winged helix-turn-helix transcriptional regulator n=1 Tax=Micromonospora sp. NBC_00898 TaxID=2975981 RepID=UPI003863BB21|nr:MarR family transcriptional regulator [Micromonospora sp. NBC_00898]
MRERPNPPRLEKSAAGRPQAPVGELADTIGRLRRALRRGARVADPGNQLSVAQLEVVASLAEHPGARPSELARLLNMRPNTLTTLVNALTTQGMITRRAGADRDRRAVSLAVTDDGLRAVHAWQATNSAVLNLAVSVLTPAQRTALARATPALGALAEAVDQLADTPPPGPRGEMSD